MGTRDGDVNQVIPDLEFAEQMVNLNVDYSWLFGEVIAYFAEDLVGFFFVSFKPQLLNLLPVDGVAAHHPDEKPDGSGSWEVGVFLDVVDGVLGCEASLFMDSRVCRQ